MICNWCDSEFTEHFMIIRYYSDYGNVWERDEVYCSFRCLRRAIE